MICNVKFIDDDTSATTLADNIYCSFLCLSISNIIFTHVKNGVNSPLPPPTNKTTSRLVFKENKFL